MLLWGYHIDKRLFGFWLLCSNLSWFDYLMLHVLLQIMLHIVLQILLQILQSCLSVEESVVAIGQELVIRCKHRLVGGWTDLGGNKHLLIVVLNIFLIVRIFFRHLWRLLTYVEYDKSWIASRVVLIRSLSSLVGQFLSWLGSNFLLAISLLLIWGFATFLGRVRRSWPRWSLLSQL